MIPANPESLFADVATYVEKAQAMLANGEWVDLKGLDKDVEALCLSISALSPEQATEYAPELVYLKEQVEKLEQQMRLQRDDIHHKIKSTDTVERANKAYAQSTSLKPDEKP